MIARSKSFERFGRSGAAWAHMPVTPKRQILQFALVFKYRTVQAGQAGKNATQISYRTADANDGAAVTIATIVQGPNSSGSQTFNNSRLDGNHSRL